jgi:hypothetical protein
MPRLSLTKRQLESPVALDLLQLLQTITADGHLTEVEIGGLREWLRTNEHEPLPAIEYLSEVVCRVLEDSKVSDEEQAWIQKAVETVMPVVDREEAATRRREADAAARREAREDKERLRDQARLDRPVGRFDFMAAGAYYDGRQEVIRNVCEGDRVILTRETGNPYSKNAILLTLEDGRNIGYVPEVNATSLAPLLDSGVKHEAEIKKILEGGRGLIPVVWGELFAATSPNGGLVRRATYSGSSAPPLSISGPRAARPPAVVRGPTTLQPKPSRTTGIPAGFVLFIALFLLLALGLVLLRGCLLR